MKIGLTVKAKIATIFNHCERRDPSELIRLQDHRYSKKTFDINYPFCLPADQIRPADAARYWRQEYVVNGIAFRVTSQWFNPPVSRSLPLFLDYLVRLGLAEDHPATDVFSGGRRTGNPARTPRGRYRSNAIGNAQNYFVRNILSRLGDEQFGADDWAETLDEFGRACAYCGSGGELIMDHVVPINKQALGEHKLGNLVPSCRDCNARKSEQDYQVFLAGDVARISAIEAHMQKHGYAPISGHEQTKKIIELAHQEIRALADRYVEILNSILSKRDLGPKG